MSETVNINDRVNTARERTGFEFSAKRHAPDWYEITCQGKTCSFTAATIRAGDFERWVDELVAAAEAEKPKAKPKAGGRK